MIISAHIVRNPRKEWGCEVCDKPRDRSPHVVAYGCAERGDQPYRMRFCIGCASHTRGDTTVFLVAMKFIGEQQTTTGCER